VIDTDKNVIILALLTSINISGSPPKQVAVFVLMMAIYTIGAFSLMYFYWKKSMEWRYRKHSH
jgi:Kef-type K+ transport system membrane component KefB